MDLLEQIKKLEREREVLYDCLRDTYDALEGVPEADDTDHPLWIQKHVIDSLLRPELTGVPID